MAVELGNISEQLFRVELHVDVVSQNLLEFLLFAPLKIKEKEKIYRARYLVVLFFFFSLQDRGKKGGGGGIHCPIQS